MTPIKELLQAVEAQESVDQDTVPAHDLVFGAKTCQRFFVILSGGANGDSIHPKASYKLVDQHLGQLLPVLARSVRHRRPQTKPFAQIALMRQLLARVKAP